MAALTAVNPTVSKGGHMETVKKLILNGQSWSAGQFLFIDANGLLEVCAITQTVALGGIKYYALTDQADPGAVGVYAEVGVITRDTIFEIHEKNGTVADANVGDVYNLFVDANVCTIDVEVVSKPALMVTEIAQDYERIKNVAADTSARLRVRVLSTLIDALGA